MNDANTPGLSFPARSSVGRDALWIGSIALIYFGAARTSLLLEFQPEGIAAIWPPTGLFLSAVLLIRRDLRPWLVGTLFFADLTAERLAGTPFLVSALYSSSLAGDAVLSAWLLSRFVGEPLSFRRVREVVGWLAFSVVLSNTLTSLLAAAASKLLPGAHSFWSSWRWSAGPDGVGNILVTPFILSWAAWARTRPGAWNRRRIFEGAALFAAMALLNFALFQTLSGHKLFALFLPYVTLPFLLWAALRFGVRGVSTALFILAAIAVPFSAMGRVPSFSVVPDALNGVVIMQLFLAVTAIPSLVLAAVVTERQQAHERVEESGQQYRAIMEQAADAIFMRDEAGRILEVNRKGWQSLGYTREELLSKNIWEIDPDALQSGKRAMWGRIIAGENITFESRQRRKDGSIFPVEVTLGPVQLPSGPAVLGIVRDITRRQETAERLRQTNRALRMIGDCNQELVRATNEADLLQGVCRIAVEQGGYRMTWVGFAEPDEARSVRPVARSGFDDGYVDQLNIVWADTERGRGPTGRAIRTGQPVAIRNIRTDPSFAPWSAEAIRHGYASSIALPLLSENRCFGALMMYSAEPDAFDPEEVKLLDGLAGDLAYGIGALRHRAERERAETLLRTSEEKYKRLIETTRTGYVILDGQGRVADANPEYVRLTGRQRLDEIQGHSVLEWTAPHDFDRNVREVTKCLQQGFVCDLEIDYLAPDGHVNPVEINATVLRADDSIRILTLCRDITGRRQSDAALRKSEERFREQAALLDAANDAIYVRTLDNTVTYWNAGAERLFGWPRAEALGRKITELGDSNLTAFEAAHAALLKHGNWSGELKKTNRQGRERHVFCRWTLLRDDRGTPSEVLAINTDITEQKQLETRFLRAQRMEGIGSLAGGIAHDLNNILTPILMTVPLLRESAGDTESREMLDTVLACTRRGADIIRQLLTFARGQPGVRVPLPMRHLLREMEVIIRETFPRNIHLVLTVCEEPGLVLGDATQIHQTLMNLCVNARDAMPDGGTLTLAVDNRILDEASAAELPDAKPGIYLCVSVTDTGIGIPREHLERIFDPFFTTKEIGKGTGLGLPTVLGIVRGHGGFVRVDSQVGKGTRIELFLPAASPGEASATPDRDEALPQGKGELVLVVDDENTVRAVVQRMLEKHGYRVVVAEEGNEALDIFSRRRADIKAVIADMMMPGMDGPALVRALRQSEPRLPILGMTGMAGPGGFKGLEGLEVSELLAKPFPMGTLLAALQRTLSLSDLARSPDSG